MLPVGNVATGTGLQRYSDCCLKMNTCNSISFLLGSFTSFFLGKEIIFGYYDNKWFGFVFNVHMRRMTELLHCWYPPSSC